MKTNSSPFGRAISYLIRSVIVIAIIIFFLWACYQETSQITNVSIITVEGMTARAEVIINAGDVDQYDSEELAEYFLTTTIQSDSQLANSIYQYYLVSNYDYTVSIDKVHVWPWSKKATVDMHEITTPVNGSLNDIVENDSLEKTPPNWDDKAYKIHLRRDGKHRWYIERMEER